jgi:HEAT repeats
MARGGLTGRPSIHVVHTDRQHDEKDAKWRKRTHPPRSRRELGFVDLGRVSRVWPTLARFGSTLIFGLQCRQRLPTKSRIGRYTCWQSLAPNGDLQADAPECWDGATMGPISRALGGRLLRADQPVFVRREAASSLGRDIPSWELDRAVFLLINALDDPSPRLREYAGVGLAELGPRAEQAASKLITVLNDEDRFVRFSAARTRGLIIDAGSAKRAEAVAGLTVTLKDKEAETGPAPTGISRPKPDTPTTRFTRWLLIARHVGRVKWR